MSASKTKRRYAVQSATSAKRTGFHATLRLKHATIRLFEMRQISGFSVLVSKLLFLVEEQRPIVFRGVSEVLTPWQLGLQRARPNTSNKTLQRNYIIINLCMFVWRAVFVVCNPRALLEKLHVRNTCCAQYQPMSTLAAEVRCQCQSRFSVVCLPEKNA